MGRAAVPLLICVTVQTATSFSAPLMVSVSLKIHFTSLFLDVPYPSWENSGAGMPWVESDCLLLIPAELCLFSTPSAFKGCELGAHDRTLPMHCGNPVF